MKKRISKTRAALLCLLAGTSLPGLAQTGPTLPETVVTATRVAQPVTELVADVSVVDRAEIERLGFTSVPQILARLPGLQTISYGDTSRVYIRGADSRMTALYIDGVRVDSQDGLVLGGGAPWELVPASQIERIEVLRGPASAVYGSDAMGGVIQIFTRRGQSGVTPYASVGVGGYNTQKLSAGVYGGQGAWDYALGAGYENSEGFNTRPDLVHTPEREPYTQSSANVRLGYQISSAHRAEIGVLENQLDSRYVPWGGGTDFSAHGKLSTASLKWLAQWGDVYSTSVTLSRSRVAKRDDVPYDFQTTLQGLLLENRWRLSTGTATAVLEQKRDDFDSQPSGYGDPAFGGGRTQNAFALGYGAVYGLHSLQLNARNDHDSIFGEHPTGALAYGYAFAPKWRATLSTGTAFRAPTLEQIYGPYGSAQLQPETNRSTEAGIGYGDETSTVKAVVYHNAISNMITSSQTLNTCSAGFFCYYNVGQATIRGVTLSGRHSVQHYELRGSLDLLDPRDDITGLDLSLRARRTMSLGVDRRGDAWLLGAEVLAVGERFDDAANTVRLAGYTLLNLSASTQIAREWQLLLRMDNATNAVYQQVGNYATPGRTVFVTAKWEARQ